MPPVGNAVFFLYFDWFIPPLILLLMIINLLIDALVLLLGHKLFRIESLTGINDTEFLWKTVFKVWLLGFVADSIGVFTANLVLFAVPLGLEVYEVVVASVAVVVAGVMIYLLNYALTFGFLKEYLMPSPQLNFQTDNRPRIRLCLLLAIVTAPWTLFIPLQWLQGLMSRFFVF